MQSSKLQLKIQNFKSFSKTFHFALSCLAGRRVTFNLRGFTLVEVLVVIAMLGIIAAGVFVAINPAQQIKKANDAKRKSNIAQLQRALELYNNDNNGYPQPGCDIDGSGNTTATCCSSQPSLYITGLTPTFMVELPHDPLEPTSPGPPDICYARGNSDVTGYKITYRLENRNDASSPGTPAGNENVGGKTFYVYEVKVN